MFNNLAVMGAPIGNDGQVAIFSVSVSSGEPLSGAISGIKTMNPINQPGNTYRDG